MSEANNAWRIGRTDLQSFRDDGRPVHYIYPPDGMRLERIPVVPCDGSNFDHVAVAKEIADAMNLRDEGVIRQMIRDARAAAWRECREACAKIVEATPMTATKEPYIEAIRALEPPKP